MAKILYLRTGGNPPADARAGRDLMRAAYMARLGDLAWPGF